MSKLATLDGLRLLLEYARDELEAVGMTAAAQEVGLALISVRTEVIAEERKEKGEPALATYPAGRLRLVYDRSRGDKRSRV